MKIVWLGNEISLAGPGKRRQFYRVTDTLLEGSIGFVIDRMISSRTEIADKPPFSKSKGSPIDKNP